LGMLEETLEKEAVARQVLADDLAGVRVGDLQQQLSAAQDCHEALEKKCGKLEEALKRESATRRSLVDDLAGAHLGGLRQEFRATQARYEAGLRKESAAALEAVQCVRREAIIAADATRGALVAIEEALQREASNREELKEHGQRAHEQVGLQMKALETKCKTLEEVLERETTGQHDLAANLVGTYFGNWQQECKVAQSHSEVALRKEVEQATQCMFKDADELRMKLGATEEALLREFANRKVFEQQEQSAREEASLQMKALHGTCSILEIAAAKWSSTDDVSRAQLGDLLDKLQARHDRQAAELSKEVAQASEAVHCVRKEATLAADTMQTELAAMQDSLQREVTDREEQQRKQAAFEQALERTHGMLEVSLEREAAATKGFATKTGHSHCREAAITMDTAQGELVVTDEAPHKLCAQAEEPQQEWLHTNELEAMREEMKHLTVVSTEETNAALVGLRNEVHELLAQGFDGEKRLRIDSIDKLMKQEKLRVSKLAGQSKRESSTLTPVGEDAANNTASCPTQLMRVPRKLGPCMPPVPTAPAPDVPTLPTPREPATLGWTHVLRSPRQRSPQQPLPPPQPPETTLPLPRSQAVDVAKAEESFQLPQI